MPSTMILIPRMPKLERAQVLREVIAVEEEKPGHAAEGFVQAELLGAELNLILADDADRGRYLLDILFDARSLYRDRPEPGILRADRCRKRNAGQAADNPFFPVWHQFCTGPAGNGISSANM